MIKKRLSLMLECQLCVMQIAINKSARVATLFVSDFNESTRVMLDLDSKKIISNRDEIRFTTSDINNIVAEIKKLLKE